MQEKRDKYGAYFVILHQIKIVFEDCAIIFLIRIHSPPISVTDLPYPYTKPTFPQKCNIPPVKKQWQLNNTRKPFPHSPGMKIPPMILS